jgi:hypothetical protein
MLLLTGVLLGLYGLFAILYGGDSGSNGNTYVKFSGHEVDADLAGTVALALACLVTVAAVAVLSAARRSVRSR